MATDLDNLKATRSALIQSLADEAAYQAEHGPRDAYSLEGKSHDWPGWRSATLKQIMDLTQIINGASPGIARSRARC